MHSEQGSPQLTLFHNGVVVGYGAFRMWQAPHSPLAESTKAVGGQSIPVLDDFAFPKPKPRGQGTMKHQISTGR